MELFDLHLRKKQCMRGWKSAQKCVRRVGKNEEFVRAGPEKVEKSMRGGPEKWKEGGPLKI